MAGGVSLGSLSKSIGAARTSANLCETVSPAKRRFPVSISQSTTPNAQMSARLSTGFPLANINLLRDVQTHAPGSLPAVGRAMLQGLFDSTMDKNGLLNPTGALNEWSKLGDQTKRILFSPNQIDGSTISSIWPSCSPARREQEPAR
jgi:hypothetical protein